MPIYKTKNENFFKRWSSKMAYVLGFFTADGNMIKNKRDAHFIEFQITDNDLLKLGLTPNKSKTIELPKIPDKYFSHFLRGYFDRDGCVNVCTYKRKNRKNPSTIINSGFTSGSEKLLNNIKNKLLKLKIIKGGILYFHYGYRLWFSINDSLNLYKFMYKDLNNKLFLNRKKKIFEKYFRIR